MCLGSVIGEAGCGGTNPLHGEETMICRQPMTMSIVSIITQRDLTDRRVHVIYWDNSHWIKPPVKTYFSTDANQCCVV